MDLGIAGRTAIICGASRGLGYAIASALAAAGVRVVLNSRDAGRLEAAHARMAADHAVDVDTIAADVKTAAGRDAILAGCPAPDILITNAGAPPKGRFEDLSLDDWRDAVEGTMLAPLDLIRKTVPGMAERRFGRVLNITSVTVRAPSPIMELSTGARAGLTGAVASLARSVASRNVTINNVLPGPFDTDLLASTSRMIAEQEQTSFETVHQRRADEVPAKRFGQPEELGALCAFLCSAHAGYIVGQNILIDGGSANFVF